MTDPNQTNQLTINEETLKQVPGNLVIINNEGVVLFANNGASSFFTHDIKIGFTHLKQCLPGFVVNLSPKPLQLTIGDKLLDVNQTSLENPGHVMVTFTVNSQGQTKLECSKKMLNAFEAALIGEWQISLRTQTLEWPSNSKKLFGVQKDQLPETTSDFKNHLSKPDVAKYTAELDKAKKTGHFEVDLNLVFPNKKTRWIKIVGQTEYDETGLAIAISGITQNINSRKLVELQLIESERRYRELINTCPALIYQYNLTKKRGVYYSGQFEKILGYNIEEISRHDDFLNRKIHPEDFKELMGIYKSITPNEKFATEYRLRHKKGHWVWLKDFSIQIKQVKDNLILTGIAFDQTREKDYETRLNLALMSSKLGVYEYHPFTDDFIFDDAVAGMLGYSYDEVPGKFSEFVKLTVDPEDIDGLTSNKVIAAHSSPGIKTGAYKIKHKKGVSIWVDSYSMTAEINDEGMPTRIIGTLKDITEKKQQDMAIESTNQTLQNIISSVPGVVFRCPLSNQERFDFVSDQIKELTGYEPAEFKPWGYISFIDLVLGPDKDSLSKYVSDNAKTMSDYEITYKIKHKNGNELWVWEKAGYVEIEGEIYLEGILTDISDKIKVEDRIISATLQAEDAERKRISSAIHDGVQQMLVASLFTFQELQGRIIESLDKHTQKHYTNALGMLQKGVAETRMIAHSIMPKSIHDFGLVETLEHMTDTLKNSTGINFQFYHNLALDNIRSEIATSIYRICQEATNNILKYAQAKETTIQLMEYEDMLIVSIEDDGIGFDTTKTDMLYTGLGFSLMRSRVSAISGSIDFSSRPGKGTQIVVEIPRASLKK